MTSIFFKRDISNCYLVVYRPVAWQRVYDIFYIYNPTICGPTDDIVLYLICHSGNQQCVDHFILKHPNFNNWGVGAMGACCGGHVDIVRRICGLVAENQSLATVMANQYAESLPVLLVLEELAIDISKINYTIIVNRSIETGNIPIFKHALKRIEEGHHDFFAFIGISKSVIRQRMVNPQSKTVVPMLEILSDVLERINMDGLDCE